MEDVRGKYSSSTTEFNKAKLELANLETSFANTQQNIDEKQEFIKVTEPEITSIEKRLIKLKKNI